MKQFCQKISRILRDLGELHIAVYAGNATFFILLSLFPAAMVLLTVMQYLPATVTDLQDLLYSLTPVPIHGLISAVFFGLSASGTAAVLSAAAVGTVWSITRAMVSLMNGLDAVYHTPKSRPYWKKALLGFLSSLLFFLCILGTLLLQVFGESLYELALPRHESLAVFLAGLLNLRRPFAFGILTLVFCLLYTILPCRRQRFVQNVPGALMSTAGWLIYSALFGFYVENFGSYANLYGSLTAVVIAMLWLYFCINLVFYGGLLNYVLCEVPHPIRQIRNYFRK